MTELLKAAAALVVLELRQAWARRQAAAEAARAHAASATAATRVVCIICGAAVYADDTSRAAHARSHARPA